MLSVLVRRVFGSVVIGAVMGVGVAAAQDSVTTPSKKPFDALSRTLLMGRDSLAQLTKQQIGLKYKWGAKQPGIAFDCSALVQWIAGLFGQDLPRTAAQQGLAGIEIPRDTSQLLPGDLLMFGKGKRITHVGIYVGEGKYVHAANRRRGVIESNITKAKPAYWKGVRRTFLDADSVLKAPATPDT